MLSPPPGYICPPVSTSRVFVPVARREDSPALPPLLLLLAVASLRWRQALVGRRGGGQVLCAAVHLEFKQKGWWGLALLLSYVNCRCSFSENSHQYCILSMNTLFILDISSYSREGCMRISEQSQNKYLAEAMGHRGELTELQRRFIIICFIIFIWVQVTVALRSSCRILMRLKHLEKLFYPNWQQKNNNQTSVVVHPASQKACMCICGWINLLSK